MLSIIFAMALGQQTKTPPDDIRDLQSGYRKELKVIPGDLVIDVGATVTKVRPLGLDASDLILKRYALLLGRVCDRISGIWVFRCATPDEPTLMGDRIIGAIAQLPDDALKAAFAGALQMNTLPQGTREDFIKSIATTPEAAGSLAAMGPRALVRLSFGAVGTFKQSSGQLQTFNLGIGGTIYPDSVIAQASSQPAQTASPVATPPDTDTGPLDFKEGEVLQLKDIAVRAKAVFGCSYSVDQRLSKEWFFVRGTFSKRGFESAFGKLTDVSKLLPRTSTEEDLFKALLLGKLAAFARAQKNLPIGMEELSNYPSFKPGELAAFGSDFARTVTNMQIPGNADISLSPVIYVSVNGGTSSTTYIFRIDCRR